MYNRFISYPSRSSLQDLVRIPCLTLSSSCDFFSLLVTSQQYSFLSTASCYIHFSCTQTKFYLRESWSVLQNAFNQ